MLTVLGDQGGLWGLTGLGKMFALQTWGSWLGLRVGIRYGARAWSHPHGSSQENLEAGGGKDA